MTKLYLTLEENEMLKVERVVQIDLNEYNPKILEVIEDMQNSLKRVIEESDKNLELINEARRLTINND